MKYELIEHIIEPNIWIVRDVRTGKWVMRIQLNGELSHALQKSVMGESLAFWNSMGDAPVGVLPGKPEDPKRHHKPHPRPKAEKVKPHRTEEEVLHDLKCYFDLISSGNGACEDEEFIALKKEFDGLIPVEEYEFLKTWTLPVTIHRYGKVRGEIDHMSEFGIRELTPMQLLHLQSRLGYTLVSLSRARRLHNIAPLPSRTPLCPTL